MACLKKPALLIFPRILSNIRVTSQCHYHLVKPGNVNKQTRQVPENIARPPYVNQTLWQRLRPKFKGKRDRKTPKEIQGMREACKLARDILVATEEQVKPGVTTDEIDGFVHAMAVKHNAYPSPLLYRGFPKSVCTSVNNVACHGIPDDRPLCEGDIINVDITVYLNGFHGDTSATFLVGAVDEGGRRLVDTARESRDLAIYSCGPGEPLSNIGTVISHMTEKAGFQVVADFCGHGIGQYFHGPPDIIHVENNFGGTMEEGMTFTIEPVVSEGDPDIEILSDGWTAVSCDNSRSAQFEHTILITANGPEILT